MAPSGLTDEEFVKAVGYVNWLRWKYPEQEWSITTRDELLAAAAYVESLNG